jgi:hypothetical protein
MTDDFDSDGFTEQDGDCNDCDGEIGPGALEVPVNDIDDNCDGTIDESFTPCDCQDNADWLSALDICDSRFYFSPGTWHSSGKDPIELGALETVTRYGSESNDLDVKAGCRYVVLSTGDARLHVPEEGSDFEAPCEDPRPDYNGPWHLSGKKVSSYDNVKLHVALFAPANAKGFSFDFIYITSEYPEFVGSIYNDAFYAIIQAENVNNWSTTNISFDNSPNHNEISVNSSFFEDPPQTDLSGTGYEWNAGEQIFTGGATGWYRTKWPIEPGSIFYLTFSIHDESDGVYDSMVILDNFRWLLNTTTAETIQL